MLIHPLALAVLAAFVPLTGRLVTILVGVPFLDGFYFGALLAGYLWLCHDVRSSARLVGLVAVSGAAFIVALFSVMFFAPFVPELFESFQTAGSNWGPGPTPFLFAGVLGAAILSPTFLVLVPRRSTSSIFLPVAIATGAGGVLGLVGEIAVEQTRTFASHLPLLVVWQAGMACVLAALAGRAAPVDTAATETEAVPVAPVSTPLAPASLALFGTMLVLSFIVFTWVLGRTAQGRVARANEEKKNAAWLAEAPSRDNLPPLRQQPLGETFLASVGTMTLQGEGSVRREQAPPGNMPGRAKAPDFLAYHGHYSNAVSEGSISIWQYPTRDWARYETRHLISIATRPVGTQFILDGGNDEYHWFSGDKMIRIAGRRPSVEALLDVYLKKYPSGVDAAFPLFYSQRRP